MHLHRTLAAVTVAFVACAQLAFGQADPAVFTSGTETATRFNVNGTSTTYPTGRPDAVTYAPVYVRANGGSHLRLNSVSVGIRRVGSTATPAPAVGVEVTVKEMTFDGVNYGLGNTVISFTQDLTASTTAVTQQVAKTFGANDPSLRPVVNLETVTNGINGYAGFWVGVRFTGVNSSNGLNGWRVCIEPAVGRGPNRFGIDDPFNTGWGANYWFGTTTGTDGVVRENMAYFSMAITGLVTDAGTVPATLRYGQLFQPGGWYRPADAADGIGSTWVYLGQFVTANAGDALTPSTVSFGLYRAGTVPAPAPAIGVELALRRMTWDGAAYGVGDVVASRTFQLPETSSTGTVRVDWTWGAGEAAPSLPLNTDNAANAGLGGYWVAARLLGDSTALAGNNGFPIVAQPTVGASWNGFGMFDAAGVLGNYIFGYYNATYTTAAGATAYYVKPSRFLAEASGAVGPAAPPCPADLNGDHVVNGADLTLMLGSWGPCPGCPADLNGDGEVNGADLSALLGAWGPCP